MKILAIETSCDETAISFIKAGGGLQNPRFQILSGAMSSQIEIHRPFGGVFPSLAKREHLKNLPIVFKKAAQKARLTMKDIDLIAVTIGPGLEPCLWTGINFAQELAEKHKKPLLGVNHLEGHLYSFLLPKKIISIAGKRILSKIFPAIALLVSGGHTILLLMKTLTARKKLGETRDDAAGEAFDKAARLLGFPYPGGPEIEKSARNGNPSAINFPRPMINQKNYDFSFSGLKTSVLYYLKKQKSATLNLKSNAAASFQQAAIDVLTAKTLRAAEEYKVKSVILCGGVAANKALRRALKTGSRRLKIKFFVPDFQYNTDNAAMIAAAAYIQHLRGKKRKLAAQPNINL